MCELCGAKAVALGRRRLWLSNLEPGGQGWSCQTHRWTSVSSASSMKGKGKTNHDAKPVKDGEDGGLAGLFKRCCQMINNKQHQVSTTITYPDVHVHSQAKQSILIIFVCETGSVDKRPHCCWQITHNLGHDLCWWVHHEHTASLFHGDKDRWISCELSAFVSVQTCSIEVPCSVCAPLPVHHRF